MLSTLVNVQIPTNDPQIANQFVFNLIIDFADH